MNPPPPVWLLVGGVALGVGLFIAGIGVLWGARVLGQDARGRRWGSESTRMVVGLSLLVVGYHIVAWSIPPRHGLIHVPARRWWLVVGGTVLASGLTLAIDRLEEADARGT